MKKKKTMEKLRQRGLRPTKARMLILSLLSGGNGHLCPDEMLDSLRTKGNPLSPATLYQNLNKLTQNGILRCFQGMDDRMRFDANSDPHHHLMCLNCGKIVDVVVDVPIVERMRLLFDDSENAIAHWQFHQDLWLLKGICPKCRRLEAPSAN